jgi:hypothetical protein
VNPVPDPLLIRKSDRAENLTLASASVARTLTTGSQNCCIMNWTCDALVV